MVDFKASGLPHVLRLWLRVSKEMLPVKYFLCLLSSFVSHEFYGDNKTVREFMRIWPPCYYVLLVIMTITRFYTVVSVCLLLRFLGHSTLAFSNCDVFSMTKGGRF